MCTKITKQNDLMSRASFASNLSKFSHILEIIWSIWYVKKQLGKHISAVEYPALLRKQSGPQ